MPSGNAFCGRAPGSAANSADRHWHKRAIVLSGLSVSGDIPKLQISANRLDTTG